MSYIRPDRVKLCSFLVINLLLNNGVELKGMTDGILFAESKGEQTAVFAAKDSTHYFQLSKIKGVGNYLRVIHVQVLKAPPGFTATGKVWQAVEYRTDDGAKTWCTHTKEFHPLKIDAIIKECEKREEGGKNL